MTLVKMVKSLAFTVLMVGFVWMSSTFAQTETAESSSEEPQVSESDLSDPSLTEAEKKALEEKLARQKEQAERERRQKEEARKANSKTTKNGGVFKPTEEISEDSPVPFPVDI